MIAPATYLDSLAEVSGGGKPAIATNPIIDAVLSRVSYSGKGSSGMYLPFADAIPIKSEERDARDILTHEHGHRRHFNKNFVGSFTNKAYDLPDQPRTQSDAERSARAKVDPYYKRNPLEGYATAFENAVAFLDYTRERAGNGKSASGYASDPDLLRRQIGSIESRTPGFGMLVKELLAEPLYAKHPLRGKIFVDAKR
jgi:hypothetical protein